MKNSDAIVINVPEVFCCLTINTGANQSFKQRNWRGRKDISWLVPPINKSVFAHQADVTQTVFLNYFALKRESGWLWEFFLKAFLHTWTLLLHLQFIFHMQGSCPKNGRIGRTHGPQKLCLLKFVSSLYMKCFLYVKKKSEFHLKIFLKLGQRNSWYPKDQCYICCKTFHGRTMSRQTAGLRVDL